MRIASVTAVAFGSLHGKSLELAPGLTVIVGRNESAKSTWHAAIYAGLCGRRRGRGASTLTDRRFAELHKPWDTDAWQTEVDVVLDDGRRIQIRQDLAGKVDSRAVDLDFGRDVSDEIMNDGAPDGAKWLGLDRDSFLATACINQAALLEVLRSASALQEYLGRAAASATADVTAARALELIDDYQREHVGRVAANAVKPLKRATDALSAAQRKREAAGQAHEAYLGLVMAAEEARTDAEVSSRELDAAIARELAVEGFVAASRDASQTASEAAQGRDRLEASTKALEIRRELLARVEQLDTEFGGQPPVGLAEAEDAAKSVNDALALWAAAPAPAPLEGDSSQELRAVLEQLPEPPMGDTESNPAVVQAYADLVAARDRFTSHSERRPVVANVEQGSELAAAIAATPAVVRGLAVDVTAAQKLAPPSPETIAQLREAAEGAKNRATQLRSEAEQAASKRTESTSRRRPMLSVVMWAAAAVLGLVAIAGFVVAQPVMAAVSGLLAIASVVAGVIVAQRSPSSVAASMVQAASTDAWTAASNAEREAIKAEEARRTAETTAADHATVWTEVQARCEARSLPADAQRLRQLAEEVEAWRNQQAALEQWLSEDSDASRSVATHEARTRTALLERGADADDSRSVDDLIAEYNTACQQRSEQAAAASRRTTLEERLKQREVAEAQYEQSLHLRHAAASAVVAAAGNVGPTGSEITGGDPIEQASGLVPRLETWQSDRNAKLKQLDAARARWEQLQTLLDGLSVADLQREISEAELTLHALADKVRVLEESAAAAESFRCEKAEAAGVEAGREADVPGAERALEAARKDLEDSRREAETTARKAERAETVRSERAAGLVSVAEAEEVLAAAQAEMSRVQELANTLLLTKKFLEQAQEGVHRDIAPVLRETLTEWLPRVTDGRYSEAMIDPATLQIQVRAAGSPWRHADRLSIGTAEQIFLLLRMSLAQHLAVTGETCPLLLDDVTVQADQARTIQILEILRSVAEHRQVILFAQEMSVESWAREHLTGDQHSVISLEQVSTV